MGCLGIRGNQRFAQIVFEPVFDFNWAVWVWTVFPTVLLRDDVCKFTENTIHGTSLSMPGKVKSFFLKPRCPTRTPKNCEDFTWCPFKNDDGDDDDDGDDENDDDNENDNEHKHNDDKNNGANDLQ